MNDKDNLLLSADFSQRTPGAPAHDQFRQRWSPRSMTGQALGLQDLETLCEAGRWSPSCFNSQPWRFIYALPNTP